MARLSRLRLAGERFPENIVAFPWYGPKTTMLPWSCCAVGLNIGELRTVKITGCIPVKGPWDFVKKVSQFARQGYLVHLFTNGHNLKSWLCSLFCALAGVGHGRRTILAFGSGHAPDYVVNAGSLVRLLIRATVVLGGRLICRNERMRQALVRFGAAPHKVAIVPGC